VGVMVGVDVGGWPVEKGIAPGWAFARLEWTTAKPAIKTNNVIIIIMRFIWCLKKHLPNRSDYSCYKGFLIARKSKTKFCSWKT